ncbi:MAG TPA: FAD binding domain-containing protein [Syntrophomonadaceae bacterium]|nr:FAD binding domain-containing protein [Syntrophomonadaceae bacterium]
MIPFDFEYYLPGSVEHAIQQFQNLDQQGKNPMYYGGGTEIISMARMANISTGAVIDIKDIPQCKVLEFQEDHLVIGAGVTLTQIHESNLYPLLAQAGARVADHTIQNKITLGGNLCGTIIYREAVLPLLLADSEVVLAGPVGCKTLPINQIFKERMQLNKGEFIVQVRTLQSFLSCPYVHVKRTKEDKIHYPLLTICAIQVGNQVRTAFSGVCDFPFRSQEMESELNNSSLTVEQRVDNAITITPGLIPSNLEGSAGYRKFILRNLLISILYTLEA